jgi:hypothetical protein
MEETIIAAGLKLFIGVLTIALYALWKVRDKLNDFNFKIFWNDNKMFWIWTLSVMFIILILITVEPTTGEAIKAILGLDVNESGGSFFTLGWGLSVLVNSQVKNPIGKTQKQD